MMNLKSMAVLAFLNLVHDRRRLLVSMAGVAFAVVLMAMELGFRYALLDSMVEIIRLLDTDLVIVSASKSTLASSACTVALRECSGRINASSPKHSPGPTSASVVTSPTGAVIRDILHRLADRFPRRVLVWPVKVQGEGSAEQIAAAIRGFNALPEGGRIPRPDLLIVARGGGSLEDLWSFNEEIVVRAAADSMIPLISAVGHETDVTLIDFVSDKRAPTPTAAAEMAVPVKSELIARVDDCARRALACWSRGQDHRRVHADDMAA